jgi:CubicO group peptidase (beta-lactamase class C family)
VLGLLDLRPSLRGPHHDSSRLRTRAWQQSTRTRACGSLISTIDDVGQFLMLHGNRGQVDGKQLIKPESLQALYQRQPATGRTGYGLGFNVLKVNAKGEGVRVRHTGASGTFAQLDLENDLIFVLLTQVPQTQTQPFRDHLLRTIADLFASSDSGAN